MASFIGIVRLSRRLTYATLRPTLLVFRTSARLLIASLVTATVVTCMTPLHAAGSANRNVFRTVLKLIATISAAKATQEAGVAIEDYWRDVVAPGESVYSVAFSFDQTSWADYFSNPDVFLVVECEGVCSLLVPQIENDWQGSLKICTFRAPTFPVGSQCILRLYDDDSVSNEVWTNILATRVGWNAKLKANPSAGLPMTGVQCLEATFNVSGQIQLVDPKNNVRIDSPDLVASARFTVPSSAPADRWEMEGSFIDNGKKMGQAQIKHWYTNPLSPAWKMALKPRFLFWATLAIGLLLLTMPWKRIANRLT